MQNIITYYFIFQEIRKLRLELFFREAYALTFGSKSGGTNLKDDIMRIYEKIHLVVANPGRILDLMGKKVTNVENCKSLCLNEADKLLSHEKVHIVYSSSLLNFVS